METKNHFLEYLTYAGMPACWFIGRSASEPGNLNKEKPRQENYDGVVF